MAFVAGASSVPILFAQTTQKGHMVRGGQQHQRQLADFKFSRLSPGLPRDTHWPHTRDRIIRPTPGSRPSGTWKTVRSCRLTSLPLQPSALNELSPPTSCSSSLTPSQPLWLVRALIACAGTDSQPPLKHPPSGTQGSSRSLPHFANLSTGTVASDLPTGEPRGWVGGTQGQCGQASLPGRSRKSPGLVSMEWCPLLLLQGGRKKRGSLSPPLWAPSDPTTPGRADREVGPHTGQVYRHTDAGPSLPDTPSFSLVCS